MPDSKAVTVLVDQQPTRARGPFLIAVIALAVVVATVAFWPGGGHRRVTLARSTVQQPSSTTTTASITTAPASPDTTAPITQVSPTPVTMPLASRTTTQGLVMATHLSAVPNPNANSARWWTPSEECATTTTAIAEIGNDAARGGEGGAWEQMNEGSPGTLQVDVNTDHYPVGMAVNEDHLPTYDISYVFVQGDHLRRASARFANGSVDSADATGGLAALAVRLASEPTGDRPLVSGVDLTLDTGATIRLTDLHYGMFIYDLTGHLTQNLTGVPDADPRPECATPPVPLPSPGRQPADPTAARVSATDAIEGVFSNTRPEPEREALVTDADFARQVSAELAAGPFAATSNAGTAKVDDLVFVSPTRAIVRFDFDLPPAVATAANLAPGSLANTYGTVVLSGGKWLVTPETICKITGQVTPTACSTHDSSAYPPEIYGRGGTAGRP